MTIEIDDYVGLFLSNIAPDNVSRDVVTANYWNLLFGQIITQGDENVDAIRASILQLVDFRDTVIPGIEADTSTLQGEMTAVEGRLDVAEPKITTLQGEMTAAQDDIISLESDMLSAEGRLDTLEDGFVPQLMTHLNLIYYRLQVLMDGGVFSEGRCGTYLCGERYAGIY